MRILILSAEGDGLGVAQRLSMEGHSVDLWIKENRFDRAGKGICNRVSTWRTPLAKADLIICDMVGFGDKEDVGFMAIAILGDSLVGLAADCRQRPVPTDP